VSKEVAASILGHSEEVAEDHYIARTTEKFAEYRAAIEGAFADL
jgi:hypothetical protein